MLKNFLLFLVLALAFAGLFLMGKDDAGLRHAAFVETLPSAKMFGGSSEVGESLEKFGAAIGVALGLVAFIASAILMAILRLTKVPAKAAAGVSNLLAYGAVAGLGYELVYLEEKNSDLASAVVHYAGQPLFYAGLVATALALVFLILAFLKKEQVQAAAEKLPLVLLLITSSFFLSGCSLLGSVTEMGCTFVPGGKNQAHCYQQAAVAQNDEQVCDKAPQGEEFKKAGSNPPQDKCYYMVAGNKRDPKVCDKIKGGLMSYGVEECKQEVLGVAEEEIQNKLDVSQDGQNLSSAELAKIQKQMAEYAQLTQMMTEITKVRHDANMSIVRNFRN